MLPQAGSDLDEKLFTPLHLVSKLKIHDAFHRQATFLHKVFTEED